MDTDTSFRSCWQNWCQYLGPIENADLADICEVSSAAVTGWLNGSRKPRANKISRLSNFIHELISTRKVVIAPHNRTEFTAICTTYQHNGELPAASAIRATFEGSLSVEQVLGLEPGHAEISSEPKTIPITNVGRFLSAYATPLSFIFIVCLLAGGALSLWGAFNPSPIPSFQYSELALSVDGKVRKVSISNDGQQRAFLWKPPSSDNYDVYLVDKQHVISPILQSDANEMGLAWSPKSDALALIRITESNTCEIILFDIRTRKETFLTACNRQTHFDFVWSRDGGHLYFTSRKQPNLPSAIHSYSFNDGKIRQLTFPENISYGDYRVVESLSGNKLAFLRSDRWSYSELRTYDLTTSKDELFHEFDQIVYSIDWGFDDNEILVVPWQSPNQIESIRADGKRQIVTSRSRPVGDFDLNAERHEIILHESQFTEDIYRIAFDTSSTDVFHPLNAKPVIKSKRSDWQPKLSPDNQALAFLSNRSGAAELWISSPNGDSARPLTNGEIKGIRIFDWSPDGKKIVVDSSDDRIYVVTLATATINAYSPNGFVAKNPSWGNDSKKIYVASDTNQAWQIWAIDNALSKPNQITRSGGYHARESNDGKSLLYTRFYHDGIWQLPLNQSNSLEATSQPKNIVKSLKPGEWLQWQVIGENIYFTERDFVGLRLMRYNLIKQHTEKIFDLPNDWRPNFSFSISNNEEQFYFSEKNDIPGSEYILIR